MRNTTRVAINANALPIIGVDAVGHLVREWFEQEQTVALAFAARLDSRNGA